MGSPKKMSLKKSLFFLYLILFPFGQILSFSLKVLDFTIRLHPNDIIAILLGSSFFLKKEKAPRLFEDIKNFLVVVGFSWAFSFTLFPANEVLLGFLYFFRLVAYCLFFLSVHSMIRRQVNRELVLKSLLAVSSFIAIFGLYQYFAYPDVRALTVWEWDDHLLRLVGTFLDPGFTVIFLVFGFLISLALLISTQKKFWLLPLGLALLTTALTYSRAGYLALVAGAATLLFLRKKLVWGLAILLVLIAIVAVIPGQGSEGVLLTRTTSIFERLGSYSEGWALFTKSPVFGVGYNNTCIAKAKFLGQFVDYSSHACSGVASGPLLVLATSGLIGFISLFFLGVRLIQRLDKSIYATVFLASGVSLLVHSLFTNSLFYPWVMGYLGILLSVSLRERNLR